MRAQTRNNVLWVLSVGCLGVGMGGLAALEFRDWAGPPAPATVTAPTEMGHVLVDLERVALRHPRVLVDGLDRPFKDLLMGLAVEVPLGEHTLSLVDGTMMQQWPLHLEADDPHVHVTFTAGDAALRIGTEPFGALLEVDGRDLMVATPISVDRPLLLAQGRHSMVFTHEGTRYAYDVDIPAGDSTLMILNLGRDAQAGHAVFTGSVAP